MEGAKKVVARAKKVHEAFNENLENIRSKTWAEPVGKVLTESGKVMKACGNFVPGASIIGGALAFGGSVLNPEVSSQDMMKKLNEIQETINSCNFDVVKEALRKEECALKEKITNPPPEVRSDFDQVQKDMKKFLAIVQEENANFATEMNEIKDVVNKTYGLVIDLRYKIRIIYLQYCENIFLLFIYYLAAIDC